MMVPLARLERALRKELDFESSASTNSTTGALRECGLLASTFSAGKCWQRREAPQGRLAARSDAGKASISEDFARRRACGKKYLAQSSGEQFVKFGMQPVIGGKDLLRMDRRAAAPEIRNKAASLAHQQAPGSRIPIG